MGFLANPIPIILFIEKYREKLMKEIEKKFRRKGL